MGKMYTLQPGESINDHVKESMSIINHIVELSIGCMRDLANPHEGTFVDMTYNNLMRSLEHIRESIQMLDELCDELDEDLRIARNSCEALAGKCPYRDKYCGGDYEDCAKCDYVKANKQLELFLDTLKENAEQERKKSNQLEKQLKDEHEKYMKLREAKEHSPAYWKAKFERIQKKYNQLDKYCRELETEIDFLRSEDEEYIDTDSVEANNPQNFCGNCKYFTTHPNDVGTCNNKHADPFIVDPDDASCPHFKSNQVDRDKPDSPCCKDCNRDDCDNCTLCPF